MATPRKRNGYVYRQQLNRVLRCNEHARQIVGRILDNPLSQAATAMCLAAIAHDLGEQRDAIAELEAIE